MILAETLTTPRHNGLLPVHGRNQDCRVRLHAITPPGVDCTRVDLFICLFIYLFVCLFIYPISAACLCLPYSIP
jgi:hypothetical protein